MSLDVPPSLADAYISSTLYVERPEEPARMPWLCDIPPSDVPQVLPSLETFAHTCKIRLIQSYIMHTMQAVPTEGGATTEWQHSMSEQIDNVSLDLSLTCRQSFANRVSWFIVLT